MLPQAAIEREISRLALLAEESTLPTVDDVYAAGAMRALRWALSDGSRASEADMLNLPELQ